VHGGARRRYGGAGRNSLKLVMDYDLYLELGPKLSPILIILPTFCIEALSSNLTHNKLALFKAFTFNEFRP